MKFESPDCIRSLAAGGRGSAFFVRHQADADFLAMDLSGDFGGSEADGDAARLV